MKKLTAFILFISLAACTGTQAPQQVKPLMKEGSLAGVISGIESQLQKLEEQNQANDRKPFLDKQAAFTLDTTGAPSIGPENAAITMVVFSDFQCPFCTKFANTAHELLKRFPNDLRLVFMNFPLNHECNPGIQTPMHPLACDLAEVAMAAHDQGKFWEMHDFIFGETRPDLNSIYEFAQSRGMDSEAIRAAVEQKKFADAIASQCRQGLAAQTTGTPTVFINGMKVRRARWDDAQSVGDFIAELIHPPDEQGVSFEKAVPQPEGLPSAEVILEDGTRLSDRLNSINKRVAALNQTPEQPVRRELPPPDPNRRNQFMEGNRPFLGPENAPVTIVAFIDALSPHTELLLPVLRAIVAENPGKVKAVIKINFARTRPAAIDVHEALVEAIKEGKFWDVIDKIVKGRDQMTVEAVRQIMKDAGVDMAAYDKHMGDHSGRPYLGEDYRDARRAGVRDAPAIFVNGKLVSGAAKDSIEAAVKTELENK